MAYIILGLITIFFAVVGFTEIMKFIIFRFYKHDYDNTVMLISPISAHTENPEYNLRSCAERVKWMGNLRPKKTICICTDSNPESKKICSLICDEYDFLELMTPEDFSELINAHCDSKHKS